MNNKVYIAAAFFVSCVVGFGVGRLLKSQKDALDISIESSRTYANVEKPAPKDSKTMPKDTGAIVTEVPSNIVAAPVGAKEKDLSTEKKEEKEKPKMTAKAFQALLANRSDNSLLGGHNPQVAKSISFSIRNMKEGENRPDDVLSIRQKVSYGVWAGIRVVSVGYDSNNRISSAVIEPIYKESE